MKQLNFDYIKSKIPDSPGILCEDNYLKTSVLIPLVEIKTEIHLLFEVRSKNIRQGSEVCFPGGKYDFEKDNSYRDTAVRETIEELGIKSENIKVLGEFGTLFTHMGMMIYTFIGILDIDSIENLNIDENEVSEIFTVPLRHFVKNPPKEYKLRMEAKPVITDESGKKVTLFPVKQLGLPEKYENPWGSNKHKVIVYEDFEPKIWGLTAKIVFEFVKKLNLYTKND